MPELPEVETTLRGIFPYATQKRVADIVVRQRQLRWSVPENLPQLLSGKQVDGLLRRGKYLLWRFDHGHLMMHLGMSGSLRVVPATTEVGKHDHVDIVMVGGQAIRLTDPRRFGAVLWVDGEPGEHPLLRHLGPEPLSDEFDGDYLFRRSRKRKLPVKSLIMDSKIVVGVGNIYANEALFAAGIHPLREAGRISCQRYGVLVQTIKDVLARAIEQGGTTLKDFVGGDGKPGYFAQQLHVYGRGGEPCTVCGKVLKEVRLGQRATVYCGACQR
ncbi:bifunctional DNA-formamidopyrimidine glycosylase/DNA-(apurinic or apyrimidinic site) lyase [Porticoccus sp. W117]|uniref:bifunctional DNA-formamidopyrimidine glycosylase/DNA-(apurinic or apyrimidinic site) lyase n=1 Tax=Porticoccus sp. W117 TaxID=3054777 RepID=UPI0025925CF6|nr:bifunctional DNA-formamidopyrimidine glycosylase/DNA-(apurinic or apyrimidinic site) lyase [Porticoccus sp. W117]MDM3870545.1 bifunctional DNA-formamidopyrimidine glycosylase/DNA-(apurinic or apyrimidinic site) lyase [Porticoccus sp. W117]